MTKLEKKYGKYAVKDLTLMLIMCYGVGYVIQFITPQFLDYLTLDPYCILHGQIWRLLTWVVIPPTSLGIFTIITLFFYYSVGVTLERTWGDFKYNVYILSGMIFTIIGAFASMGVLYLVYPEAYQYEDGLRFVFANGATLFSTYYINMSILLAFAATFPDSQVLLMFVVPVKMKWLGIIYAALLVLEFVNGYGSSLANIFYRIAIASSLLNFIIFFLINKFPKKKNNIEYFRRHYK